MVVATSLLGFITRAFSAFSRIERPHIAWTSVTIAIFALLTCAYVSPSPASAAAGINRQINFQGRLLNSNGATVPDGFYNIQFKIYQDGDGLSVGNTTGSPAGTLMWTESHLNANSQGVTVKNGFLSVQLGSINAFANQIDWNQDTIWLSMNIGNTNASCTPFSSCSPDGEMVPMKRMTATPYALNSGLLNGLTSSNFVQLAQGVQTDASAGPSSIFINKTAAGNLLQLQSSGADAFTVSNAGDLTFGAAADHTISIATAAASTAGKTLTLVAGAGGSGTGSAGGDLVIQGGAAGGTDGNGGNLTINAGAKTGTGTDGTISIGTANTSAITLGQNTNVTGTLGVSSNIDTNGSLTVGNADQFVVSNLGVVTAGTWQGTAVNDTYVADTLTVDSSSTVDWQALNNYPAACAAGSAVSQLGDTITCTAFATGTAGSYIQNQSAGAQATADFWISGSGRATGSFTADTSIITPTIDTATGVALNIGTSGAPTTTVINLNQNTTLAAGKSLTITGGNTASRPGSPTEGMVYFDSDTDKLLIYSGGKWQADRSSNTKIVAASNSPQEVKDAADYVADGTGDQTEINAALNAVSTIAGQTAANGSVTASGGGKVYLAEGTYVANATIIVPNNTTLAGAGRGTLIELADLDATDNLIENSDTTTGTGVRIQDLRLDGRSDLNTAGAQNGISFDGVGSGITSTSRQGGQISGVTASNFRSYGIYVTASTNVLVTGNRAQNNTSGGIGLNSSATYNTVSNNVAQGNVYGLVIGSNNNLITGNNVLGNSNTGIYVPFGDNNTITGNSIQSNTSAGIVFVTTADNNMVSNNRLVDNGSTTTNNAIYIDGSDGNTVTGNTISDASATTTNYAINISNSTSDNTYVGNNSIGSASINNVGTGTIFTGQHDGTTYRVQPADDFAITGTSASTVSTTAGNLTLQAGSGTVSLGTSTSLTANAALTLASGAASALTLTSNAAATWSTSAGALTLTSAAAATWSTAAGDLTLDSAAALNLGTVNATGLSLSKTGSTTTINGHLTIATGQNLTLNGDVINDLTGSGLTVSGSALTVDASSATGFFRNGGNSFGTGATLGTNDTNELSLRTNGTTRATFASGSNTLYMGNGNASGLAASPSSFTIQATSNSGTGAGGSLTIQAGGSGASANGADLNLSSGIGGNNVNGQVVISTPTFKAYTGALQTCSGSGTSLAVDQQSIDNFGTVNVASTSSVNCTISVPNPTITTAGRVLYITADNTSTSSFVLSINGGGAGNLVAMRANSSATLVWNGAKWAPAGASSSTTLQAAYDNTIQSSGGAELIISKTASTNGLTIRDDLTNSVNGALVNIQSKTAANLFSVNSNVTDYASNPGAETQGASASTFPSTTWSAYGTGASVARNTTTNNNSIATGQASVTVTTSGGSSANTGTQNQIVDSSGAALALLANNHYNVSFSVRLPDGASTFNDLNVRYQYDGTVGNTVACTTGKVVAQNVWTKVNCSFTTPASGITSANVIRIEQGSTASRTFYVDNLSVTIAADYSLATDGSVDAALGSNWNLVNGATIARSTTYGNDASSSVEVTTSTTTNQGVNNLLSIKPLQNTLYRVTAYIASTTNMSGAFDIRYSPDNGSTFVSCEDYNTSTISTSLSAFTKVTCYIPTGATTVTTPYVYFRKTDATARVFYIDTFSMTLAAPTTPNVQVGSGTNGGPTTLFTLDRGASAPIAGDNESLLGSMYYDTTLGKLQCYEADGWGACGSSPDNIITISPEYTNAVMHGTGVGTMISDLCSDFLNINDGSSGQSTICGANETYNFYNWTSPQASSQTYSIYVTYQLPNTFKSFTSGSTSLQGRVSSTSNASVSYSIYKNTGSSMVQCGTSVSVGGGAANTWETKVASGAADPSACGFSAGNSIVFKISMSANSNANAYIGNIGFTFSNN